MNRIAIRPDLSKVTRYRILLLALALLLWTPLPIAAETAPDLDVVKSNGLSSTENPSSEPTESGEEGIIQRLGRGFSLHKDNYVLPLTWANIAEGSKDAELKFQFSFKQRISATGFHFAYTQKSFWRILDQEDSRPFRETNHNPELFYRLSARRTAWGLWGGDLGYEHESNGAREPTSRSWDRGYVAPFVEFRRLRAELKLWYRLSEEVKEDPLDPTGDENPDIEDFYGYGEFRLACEPLRRHRAALMLRWNFATDKGALEVDYSLPTGTPNLFIYAHLWTGYGESLIDYNRSITRYGIGLQIRQ